MSYDTFLKTRRLSWAFLGALAVLCCFSSPESIYADKKRYFEEKTDNQRQSSFSEKLKKLNIPNRYALQEIIIGDQKAPQTIIIYTSFTCGRCKKFHLEELQTFIKKYVDTGRVKIYLRSYLEDEGSLEASMLVRCFGEDSLTKTIEMYDKLFSVQEKWQKSLAPQRFLKDVFMEINRAYGEAEINSCLGNINISAGLMQEQKRALHDLKIILVPAFVVNGKVYQGFRTAEELGEILGLKPLETYI
jgi:protein-disulfide isomerase